MSFLPFDFQPEDTHIKHNAIRTEELCMQFSPNDWTTFLSQTEEKTSEKHEMLLFLSTKYKLLKMVL